MRAHAEKYDEHMLKAARNAACGLPPGAGGAASGAAGKCHVGGAGRGAARMSAASRVAINARWAEVVLPATGHATHAALRQAARAELGWPLAGGEVGSRS
jgi:glycerate-2-kinase